MRITRLYLRNYRVYEDELDLELPPGLVGVYGPNGAGKSLLVESVLWTIFGYSRTPKEEVRTAGVNGECVTEVEFEHEGHLYLVRRTLSGLGAAVKARADADGVQVAEGVQSVRRYLHSVLGMDAPAFRASVFAEQKQLASFSALRPGERQELVLRLLGITPLDRARDQARRDARAAADAFAQLRRVLPDLEALEAAAADAEAAAGARVAEADAEAAVAAAAAERLETAQAALEAQERRGREHDALVAEGKAVRAERDGAAGESARLAAELAELEAVGAGLAALDAEAAGLEGAEAALRVVEALAEAARALADLAPVAEPDEPAVDAAEAEADKARAEAEAAALRVAEVTASWRAAAEDEARCAAALARAAELSGEADCPLCGQALGGAFAQVQAHRRDEAAAARARVAALAGVRDEAEQAAAATRAAAEAAAATLRRARLAWPAFEAHQTRRLAAAEAVARAEGGARAVLGRLPGPGEAERAALEVARRRRAEAEAQRVRGRLERRAAVEAALAEASARAADAAGRLEALRDQVRSLGFRSEELDAARSARHQARPPAERAAVAAQEARLEAVRAKERADAAARELAAAREQHAALAERAGTARHLGRLAELLAAFRNAVVGSVGPRLSTQAAELFGELTDHEYDRLELDPESYEIRIRDQGRVYGMDRFSGSETDLANLAVRVAISEHVRLLSGGAVGLLVLDEVFGPLDDDRKARMLGALERLKSRFRQVLVVTHDDAIKAELPNAVEVVKRPGRRATARLVNA